MSFAGSFKAGRLVAGLGGALALSAVLAPAASGDFSLAPCTGEGVVGRGASFQNSAITGFVATFRQAAPNGCGSSAPSVLYDPAGSGAGRAALGVKTTANPNQDRDPATRFAGTDEPPTPSERAQIEKGPIDANGQDVTGADDGKVHVIPVAIGANAVIVRLPDGCDYSAAADRFRDRPTMTNTELERVFAGELTTWGAVFDGLDSVCAAQQIKRVVRLDSSGTTFSFKQLLAAVNPSRNWSGLSNTAWPNDSGGTAVTRPTTNGNGPVRDLVNTTAGSIGYGDLATARGGSGQAFTWANAADTRFWLPLQRRDTAVYDDPQADPDGYKAGSPARGANCASVSPRNVPEDSYGNWFPVDSTYTATGYGACALTYDLAFDDHATVYCNSAIEERKARTVKDYLALGVVSDGGQASLTSTDYDALPGFAGAGNAAVPGSILAKARAAVASISWKKDGSGRPCSAPPVSTPVPTATPTATTPPGTVAPPAVSNAFSVTSARIVGKTVRLGLQMPGAGALRIASAGKPRKGRSVVLPARQVAVPAAGAQRVTVALSQKARRALTRTRRLKLTMRITFTPQGGTARTVTRAVTFRVKRAAR